MIKIKNFRILNNGQDLAIELETALGNIITSLRLWKMDDFKDYSKAINLSNKLEQVNNKEVLLITASEANLSKFEDIVFIEVESDYVSEECSNCLNPAIGLAYDITTYYNCLLKYFFENFYKLNFSEIENEEIIININLTIDAFEKAVEVGYYLEAIDLLKKLKKICSFKECSNCPTIECNTCNSFKQLIY